MRRVALATFSTCAVMLMSGCAIHQASEATPSKVTGFALHGVLHGGQQPVAGSTIQLYQAGTTGYGTGAMPLIAKNVVTDAGGAFDVTGDYTCTSGSYVYITATGGNAGAGTNSAIAIMAGLGLCDNLNAIPYISLNEVTTIGSVWALSPFMNGSNVGAPGSNQAGLALAFADVNQIVNVTNGRSPGASLPTGAVAPVSEINTLADILASCINSAAGCSGLFNNAPNASGTIPADTITAAVNIARNPGANVGNLLALSTPTAPFQPTLTTANDFTVGITYPVGTSPAALAIDGSSNVWVANNGSNSVTRLTHAGQPALFTAGGLSQPTGIAIDSAGDAWISNTNNTLTELTANGTNAGGSPFSGGGLNQPTGVAIDGLGMVWVANGSAATTSVFSSSGVALSPGAGYVTGGTTASGEVSIAISPR